ncbi:MAG: rod-binding protein [Lachnospiraceae bacterium]|nr:rod-binding protein [Lachnospiraceae bacterium]MBQ2320338.1 rod-binding protein [Lachnospiraceae bacterium]
MSSILDVSSLYNSYNITSSKSSSLQSDLKNVNDKSSDDELMNACKGFESYFVQKIIEQAKKTVKSEDDQGEYMQYFGDTLNQTYADIIADSGSVGLAKQLYDSMKSTYNL